MKAKKILSVVGNVLLWVFIVLAALLTITVFTAQKNTQGLPSLFGKMPVSVLSDSMSPTFKSGDLIISRALETGEKSKLAVGDVITYAVDLNGDGKAEINTHRIVEVTQDGGYVYYATQGDNQETNPVKDDYLVSYDQVQGVYTGTKIGGLGKAMNFLSTSKGFLICIVLPLVIFFLFELYRFIVTIMAVKGKGKLTEEEKEALKQQAVEEYLKEKALKEQQEAAAPEQKEEETAGVK